MKQKTTQKSVRDESVKAVVKGEEQAGGETTNRTPQGEVPAEIHIKGFTSRDKNSLKKVTIKFGNRLRQIRTNNELTQKEMAKSLGLNAMTYSRYENGTRIPDADICAHIVTKFGVDPAWLLFGDQAEGGPIETQKVASNYTSIPVYELANAEHTNELIFGEPIESIAVPKAMVHEHTIAIIYRDANMAPYIMPGAVVGIGTKLNETPMGHVYAVWVPNTGTQLFKAYSTSLSEIALRSDNPATPDIVVDVAEFKKVVLGRVEWLFQAC